MAGEVFVLVDEPSTGAFLLESVNSILLVVALALVTGFIAGKGGGTGIVAVGLVAIGVVVSVLTVRRIRAWYVRYVLTDFRLIRSSGVLHRELAWIPWSKVTDVILTQTFWGRLFGFATVRLESANEASGLKAISDLRDPHRFHRIVTAMVEAKQGRTVPAFMKEPAAAGAWPAPPPPDDVTIPGMSGLPLRLGRSPGFDPSDD